MLTNLVVLLILNVAMSAATRFFLLFLPLIGAHLGASTLETGFAITLGGLIRTLALIPSGLIAQKTRRDKEILFGCGLCQCASFLLLSVSALPIQLFLITPIQGVSHGITIGFLLTRISASTTKGKLGRTISLYSATFIMGITLGSGTGGFLLDYCGHSVTLRLLGGVLLLSTGSLVFYHSQPVTLDSGVRPTTFSLEKKRFARSFPHLISSYFIHNIGYSAFFVFFSLYMIDIGGTATLAGGADSINNITSLILTPFMGKLVDQKGARAALLIAFWGDLALVLLLQSLPVITFVLPLMLLNGLNGAASMTGVLSMAAQENQERRSDALTVTNTVGNLGMTFSSTLGGGALEAGGFSLLFSGSAGLLFLGALWALLKVHPGNRWPAGDEQSMGDPHENP